jgi:glycosyltransferase involved in cell wall biosynthesis
MEVHQFATSLTYGDAISNELMEIRKVLREQGFQSEIFIRFFDPRMAEHVHDYREYKHFSRPDNIVIFHFSIGSPVSKLFFRIPDKKIILYHNITSHAYFLDFHRILTRECYKGRLELQLFRDKTDLALGDSEFNRRELEQAGYPRTGVLPLLLDLKKFDRSGDAVVPRLFDSPKWTLLYVGRVIPNKRFEDVIKCFYFYKTRFNADSRLILAGDYRGMERYYAALIGLVEDLDLEDVHFTGHIRFDELVAYYDLADAYLSMSEHEGFGVPLLESFHKGIPVVAYAAGAVEETLNGGGILLAEKEYLKTAALLEVLRTNRDFKRKVTAAQQAALARYDRANTGRILLEHIERVGRT